MRGKILEMKKIQNINLIVLSLIFFIIVCLGAAIYYINNLVPKKVSIKDDVQMVENNNKTFEIESIEQGKTFSKITVKKKMNEEELKKRYNYTLGEGRNYYFNYTIILSNNDKNYKVKTIIDDKNLLDNFDKMDKDGYIYIVGIFLNKNFFNDKYSVGIIQKDYKEDYKKLDKVYYKNLTIIGENNEKK